MHYQRGEHQEAKLVRCLRGCVADMILDLRPASPTRHQSLCVQLESDSLSLVYVPRGCAHGFLTLTPDVEMEYMVSAPYAPEAEFGIRYNDPFFNLPWPAAVNVISARDASWPNFDPGATDRL
jgi:dTDP-4-dehydrorhamnose 3,5-epimerase